MLPNFAKEIEGSPIESGGYDPSPNLGNGRSK